MKRFMAVLAGVVLLLSCLLPLISVGEETLPQLQTTVDAESPQLITTGSLTVNYTSGTGFTAYQVISIGANNAQEKDFSPVFSVTKNFESVFTGIGIDKSDYSVILQLLKKNLVALKDVAATLTTPDSAEQPSVNGAVRVAVEKAAESPEATTTAEGTGEYVFAELPLGIYLVVETGDPTATSSSETTTTTAPPAGAAEEDPSTDSESPSLSVIASVPQLTISANKPAWKYDPVLTLGETPQIDYASLDLNKKASLALNKYKPGADTNGDGVPDDPKMAVAGAQFTAYQVAKYYTDGNGNTRLEVTPNFAAIPELAALFTAQDGLSYGSTQKLRGFIPQMQRWAIVLSAANVQSGTGGAIYSSTEEPSGQYTFKDMALGIYLIVETKVPADYMISSSSFLVSLPEWIQDTDIVGASGEWVYDVTAYPKDDVVKLKKQIVLPKDHNTEKTHEDVGILGDAQEEDQSGLDIPIAEDKTEGDKARGHIGDTVHYQVTSNFPVYSFDGLDETQLQEQLSAITFTFTDTMSKGLAFQEGTFKVEVVTAYDVDEKTPKETQELTAELPGGSNLNNAHYSLSSVQNDDGSTVITAAFHWPKINADQYQGKEIIISYDAVIDADADVTEAGNPNEALVEYTNDPAANGRGETPPSETTVYVELETVDLTVTKTFDGKPVGIEEGQKNVTNPQDVAFSMTREVGTPEATSRKPVWFIQEPVEPAVEGKKDYTYTVYCWGDTPEAKKDDTVEGNADNGYTVTLKDQTDAKPLTKVLHPNQSDGKIVIKGLPEGAYTLTEDESLPGYNKYPNEITVTVKKDESGKLTLEATNLQPDGESDQTVGQPQTAEDPFTFWVDNSKAPLLPSTGAGGIIAMILGGLLLGFGAWALYTALNKRNERAAGAAGAAD